MCPTGRYHPHPCRLAPGCQGHCHPEGGSMGAAAEIQCFMSTWGKIWDKSPSGMRRTSTVSIQIFLYRARVLCRTYSLSWIRMYCPCVKTCLLCPGCVWVHMICPLAVLSVVHCLCAAPQEQGAPRCAGECRHPCGVFEVGDRTSSVCR